LLAVSESPSNFDDQLYVVDVASTNPRPVATHRGDARYHIIDFSADGRALYVLSDQDRQFMNLAVVDVATGAIRFLNDEKADIENASLSPDGHTLAFAVNRDGYQELGFWDLRRNRELPAPAL